MIHSVHFNTTATSLRRLEIGMVSPSEHKGGGGSGGLRDFT